MIEKLIENIKRPILKKFSGSTITQIVISISNFMLKFLLIRFVEKKEYAIFIMLFSIVEAFKGIQDALVNSPLMVLHADKSEKDKCQLISGLFFEQVLFFCTFFCIVMLTNMVLAQYYTEHSLLMRALLLSVTILAFLYKEFMRTINYIYMRIRDLIFMDLIFIVSITFFLSIFIFLKLLSVNIALIVLTIGYLSSAVFNHITTEVNFTYIKGIIKASLKETWRYSKWALLGVISVLIQNRSYIYIVSATLRLEDTADISAARLLLAPMALFINSGSQFMLSKGSDILSKQNNEKLKRFILFFILFLIVVWISYITNLFIFYNFIEKILGEKYQDINHLVLLWAFYFLIRAVRFPITKSLMIHKKFKIISIIDVISAFVTLICCFGLIKIINIYGALISITVGEIILLIPSLLIFLKKNSLDMIKK